MAEVFDLFPTPVMRVSALIEPAQALALGQRLAQTAALENPKSELLSHSRILAPRQDPAMEVLVSKMGPHLQAFGELVFGQSLRWLVKEMWVNVLQTGGQQAAHNHANCFASGVLYLSECDASARTSFTRTGGGFEFVFRNTHAGTTANRFNSEKWLAPLPAPGDLIIFPSYLMHEVPVNRGQQRVSLAFNALPHQLDAWGYTVSFQP